MKVIACNTRHLYFGDAWCKKLFTATLPPGTHYKMLFVYSDYGTVILGPKDTTEHAEWMRVGYSILAILLGLACLILPLRKSR